MKRKRGAVRADRPATQDAADVDPAEAAEAQAGLESAEVEDADEAVEDELGPTEEAARAVANDDTKEDLLPDWLAHPTIIPSSVDDGVALDEVLGLSQAIRAAMSRQGFTTLFPVMATSSVRYGHPGDLCVAAPTGSGKTLAYVLPIVQALQARIVVRLRALVILPTRELVAQVADVFRPFCDAVGLRLATSTGQTPFAAEQRLLVPESVGLAPGGASAVDILVTTPGRLMDHLSGTANFTLQHLRFLVVDEADRLLNQSYQEWLDKVLQAADRTVAADQADAPAGVALRFHPDRPDEADGMRVPLQKLLFSATLTRNPSKIASLKLVQPRYFTVRSDVAARFTTPASLKEYMVVCDSDGDKPLVLLYFMKELQFESTVCFTASVEATHRLFRLIQLTDAVPVAEFSSDLSQAQRTDILRAFRSGAVRLLICSDGMARGLDIDVIANVVSYDAPTRVQTYIHRVGRTARAGRPGSAYTILTGREMHHFKAMLRQGRGAVIPRFKVPEGALDPLVPGYQAALEQLKEVVHDERLHGAQPAVKPKRRKPAATATSRPADGGAPFAAWQTAIRESMQRRL